MARFITLFCCFCLAAPAGVMAAPITYQLVGSLTELSFSASVRDDAGNWSETEDHPELLEYWFPGLTPGTANSFGATLTFDSEGLAPDNTWLHTEALVAIIGSHVFASTGHSVGAAREDTGDFLWFVDHRPEIRTPLPSQAINPDDMYVVLFDPTSTAMANGIPSSLSAFKSGRVAFGGNFWTERSSGWLQWQATVTEIRPVPEPSTVVMFSLGAAFVMRRMRQR
jgi:hypothetical protein